MGPLLTAPLWDAVGVWRGETIWWAVSYWGVVAGLAAACVAACAGAVDYAAIEEGDPALDTASRHLTFVLGALLPYVVGMFARGGAEGPKGRAALAVLLLDGAGALLLSNERLGLAVDLREYRQCAEVLSDLGLRRVRLMSNNPLKLHAMEEAGLRVVERVPLEVSTADAATRYLRTKKEKMGHLLELV